MTYARSNNFPPQQGLGGRPLGRQLGDLARMGVKQALPLLVAYNGWKQKAEVLHKLRRQLGNEPDYNPNRPRGLLAAQAGGVAAAANKQRAKLAEMLLQAWQLGQIEAELPGVLAAMAKTAGVRLPY
jgi:hypothetical protein